MKRFLLTALLVILPAAAQINPTGCWQSVFTSPDGNKRETSLWLEADGTHLTGSLSRGDEEPTQITDGKLTGSDLSFAIVTDNFGEMRRAEYTGHLNGGRLALVASGFGRSRPREMSFHQISAVAPRPFPLPKPKISLPLAPSIPSNHLAKTPPMGWNSWNKFAGRVSDKLVRQTADAMASNGMKEAGYMYVNIDDTWQAGRDAKGNIQSNDRFPDMKAGVSGVAGCALTRR